MWYHTQCYCLWYYPSSDLPFYITPVLSKSCWTIKKKIPNGTQNTQMMSGECISCVFVINWCDFDIFKSM